VLWSVKKMDNFLFSKRQEKLIALLVPTLYQIPDPAREVRTEPTAVTIETVDSKY